MWVGGCCRRCSVVFLQRKPYRVFVFFRAAKFAAYCAYCCVPLQDIFKSPHFAELSEDSLAYIIQSDNLQAGEKEIYDAIREWGTVNMVITEKSMREVLEKVIEHCRFPLFSKDELQEVEKTNESESFIPMSLISKAWRFHATTEAPAGDPQYRKRTGSSR